MQDRRRQRKSLGLIKWDDSAMKQNHPIYLLVEAAGIE
jgi:hypothetical protein